MLKETTYYSLQCDGCGSILLNKSFETKDEIEEVMYVNLWRIICDKHYCPRCYYEENNEMIPKGKYKINENGVAQPYNLVDLGLPSGTLWMDRNIGAKEITDSGLYFAFNTAEGHYEEEEDVNLFTIEWYESQEKVDWSNYSFEDGTYVPSIEQYRELVDNCEYKFTTYNGVEGGLFTSNSNGNSIFIPADGICVNNSVPHTGNSGCLWSSSLREDCNGRAWDLYFDDEVANCYGGNIIAGFSVRGVVK